MAKKRSEMTPEEFADNLTKKMSEELSNGLGEDEEATPIYDEVTDKVVKKSE